MKESFNFGSEDVEVRPFSKKPGQLEEGMLGEVRYSTTLRLLTIERGKVSVTVGVKNPRDFDFEVLWKWAMSDLKEAEKSLRKAG